MILTKSRRHWKNSLLDKFMSNTIVCYEYVCISFEEGSCVYVDEDVGALSKTQHTYGSGQNS